MKEIRTGLSADCKLDPMIVVAILMGGREHPCDRCNIDRKECRGFPRLDGYDPHTGKTEKANKIYMHPDGLREFGDQ